MMASKKKQSKTLLLAMSAWIFVADGLAVSGDPLCIVKKEEHHVEAITWTEERGGGRNPVGCVSQSLVNHELTFEVNFDEDGSPENPFLCLKRCREEATFQNSTAALLAMSGDNRLECRCSLPNAVDSKHLGPDVFCRRSCATSTKRLFPCGGAHRFRSMAAATVKEEIYFSVYCLAFSSPPPPSVAPSSTEKPSTPTTTPPPVTTTSTEAKPDGRLRTKLLLKSVLDEMADTDLLFVATITLVAVITMVVIAISCIFCLIGRNLGFVTAGVADSTSPILDEQQNFVNGSGYGTRNEAFDPDAEPMREVYYKTKCPEAADPGSADGKYDVATYQLGQSKFYHSKENNKEANDGGDGISSTSTVPAAEVRSD